VSSGRVLPVLLSVVIIILVAVVQERSRSLAALIATMPIAAPLAMWIVFSASRGDQRQTADFVASMFLGVFGALFFLLACWFGFRREWGFPVTLIFGSAIWLLIVSLPRWVGSWLR
jgi:uncharacterized membrane protein (GlpM family)